MQVYIGCPLLLLLLLEGVYLSSYHYPHISLTHSKRLLWIAMAFIFSALVSYFIPLLFFKFNNFLASKGKLTLNYQRNFLYILIILTLSAFLGIFFRSYLEQREEEKFPQPQISRTSTQPNTTSAAPNLLFISVDTLRADHLGCYGYQRIKTPNIDYLAAERVIFRNAYAPIPLILPSHASMMTGLHPVHHGSLGNNWILKEKNITLAEVLKKQGYTTAAFISGYPLYSAFGLNQGFDYYDDNKMMQYLYPFKKLKYLLPVRLMEGLRICADLNSTRRAGDTLRAASLWIKNNNGRPFFIFLHLWDPHQPLLPPRKYYNLQYHPHTNLWQSLKRFLPFAPKYAYNSEVAYVDEELGGFLTKMKKENILDNTLVVFTADHGEGLGDHNYNEHSNRAYEEQIHIPLIMKWPGKLPPGKAISDTVRIIDIMPTILDFFAIEPQVKMDGQSFLRKIYSLPPEEDELVLYAAADVYKKYPFFRLWVLQRQQRKLIYHEGGRKNELYYLKEDTSEQKNIIKQEVSRAKILRQDLLEWRSLSPLRFIKREMLRDKDVIEKLKSLGYLQ